MDLEQGFDRFNSKISFQSPFFRIFQEIWVSFQEKIRKVIFRLLRLYIFLKLEKIVYFWHYMNETIIVLDYSCIFGRKFEPWIFLVRFEPILKFVCFVQVPYPGFFLGKDKFWVEPRNHFFFNNFFKNWTKT